MIWKEYLNSKVKNNAYKLGTVDKLIHSEGSENHGLCETYDPGNILCKHLFYKAQEKGKSMKHDIHVKNDTIP